MQEEIQITVIVEQILLPESFNTDDIPKKTLICVDQQNNQNKWVIELYDVHNDYPIEIQNQLNVQGIFIGNCIRIDAKGSNMLVCLPEVLVSPSALSNWQNRKEPYTQKQEQQKDKKEYVKFYTTKLGDIGEEFFKKLITDQQKVNQLMLEIPGLDLNDQFPPNFNQEIDLIWQELNQKEPKFIIDNIIQILTKEKFLEKSFNLLITIIKRVDFWFKETIIVKEDNNNYKIQFLEIVEISNQIKKSAFLGLSGRIDIIMRVRLQKNDDAARICQIPLELKCGERAKDRENIQQTRIYMMMQRDINSDYAPIGLLQYVQEEKIELITLSQAEVQVILHQRNLCAYSKNKEKIQKLLKINKSISKNKKTNPKY